MTTEYHPSYPFTPVRIGDRWGIQNLQTNEWLPTDDYQYAFRESPPLTGCRSAHLMCEYLGRDKLAEHFRLCHRIVEIV